MFAARVGDMQTLQLLISRGADINTTSRDDGSAMLIAAAFGHEKLALYLLNQGSDPNITDANGMTTLHYAMRDGLKVLHGYEIDFSTRVCGYALNSRCKSLASISEEDRMLLKDPSLNTNLRLYIVEPNINEHAEFELTALDQAMCQADFVVFLVCDDFFIFG